MSTEDFLNTKKWQSKYKKFGYSPKLIFGIAKTKKQLLFSLSFFLTVMASEILFNHPPPPLVNSIIGIFFVTSLFLKLLII